MSANALAVAVLVAGGWHLTVQSYDDGARLVLAATPQVAVRTAQQCIRDGLAACLRPLRAPFLIQDCRSQRVTGRVLGRQIRRAARTGPVRIVTETGSGFWICRVQ